MGTRASFTAGKQGEAAGHCQVLLSLFCGAGAPCLCEWLVVPGICEWNLQASVLFGIFFSSDWRLAMSARLGLAPTGRYYQSPYLPGAQPPLPGAERCLIVCGFSD